MTDDREIINDLPADVGPPYPDVHPAILERADGSVEEATPERLREKQQLVSKRGYRKSRRERDLDRVLIEQAGEGKLGIVVRHLVKDTLIGSIQNYANVVAIQRLGYNDHGPVHARLVTLNCLRIFDLLVQGGVEPSLVVEEMGTREDAQIAVTVAAFLHDLGMSVTRDNHESHSLLIADRFILETLHKVYRDEGRVYMLRSLIFEAIVGHMGHYRVNSVEAGIVMVGDGADATKGRAIVPSTLARNPMIGDIHRFSASAIDEVRIRAGVRKPVRIDVFMTSSAGLFQVEEVLIGKAKASPIMNFLEIAAHLEGKERLYLQ